MNAIDYIELNLPTLFASSNVNKWIAMATELTNAGYFGTQAQYAIALRIMHIFCLSPAGGLRAHGESGSIGSETEGGLSISYQATASSYRNDDLDQTSFGKQLKALIRSITPAVGVIGGGPTINTPLPASVIEADSIADQYFNR